jgi:hypothetical protein
VSPLLAAGVATFQFSLSSESKTLSTISAWKETGTTAAPAIYQRFRTSGYPWKRVNDRYKNGQPKVSPDSFQYALHYTLHGIRLVPESESHGVQSLAREFSAAQT